MNRFTAETVLPKFTVITAIITILVFSPLKLLASSNLILNFDFESNSINSTNPDNWFTGTYGSASTTFYYPASGPLGDSDKSANITVSDYLDGDAKWIFEKVPVKAGYEYEYSDSYKSDISTNLTAEYFDSENNHISYGGFFNLPSTLGEWQTSNATFTVPAGASFMTVYHLISGNGSLTIDNVNLSETSVPEAFDYGFVSLTFDDGWVSQYSNAFLEMKKDNIPGTFFVISTATKNSSLNILKDNVTTADMVVSSTTDSITWSPLYLDPSIQEYFFSDLYTATATSTISITYKTSNPELSHTITSQILPPGENLNGSFYFSLPPSIVNGVTIKHSAESGTLATSNESMNRLINSYMSKEQLLDIQRSGNEIAVHTKDHCNLSFITDTARCAFIPTGPLTLSHQINDAQSELISNGLSPANTIAYPYGSSNSSVYDFMKSNEMFVGGRGLNIGYNYKNSKKFDLKVQIIDASTTPDLIETWIQSSILNKSWLILVFHQIDNPVKLQSLGESGGTSPDIFKSLLEYIKNNNIPVKSMLDGVNIMNNNISTTTPPNNPEIESTNPNTSSNNNYIGNTGGSRRSLVIITKQNENATSTGEVLGTTTYKFIRNLRVGSRGEDVKELQNRLTLDGVYSGPITGYFGILTKGAVISYQNKYGINPVGIVGPITRNHLNLFALVYKVK